MRAIEPIGDRLPLHDVKVIQQRGPFDADDEEDLMRREGVEVLVSKNSGGDATAGKLVAARRLGLPVIMVERPPKPEVESVAISIRSCPGWWRRGSSSPSAACRRKEPCRPRDQPRAGRADHHQRRHVGAGGGRRDASDMVRMRKTSSGRPTARAKITGVSAARCAAASCSAAPSCQGRAFEIGL